MFLLSHLSFLCLVAVVMCKVANLGSLLVSRFIHIPPPPALLEYSTGSTAGSEGADEVGGYYWDWDGRGE